jgi:D-xylose transport system substrate-binding protein
MVRTRRVQALFVAAVLLVVGAGISGCGSSGGGGGGASSDKGGTIALLLPETKTTRYEEQDKPNFERRVHELCPKCTVIYSNADQDPAKQQDQAEAAITKGAKVIVMSAVDVKSASAIVQRANAQGVKVIAYGRLIPNAKIDDYVSIDPYKVGQQQARTQMQALAAKGKKTPRIVMINGAPTDSNAKPYKDGALNVYKQQGATIVKSYDTPDWSPDKAQQEMEQTVTSLGKTGFDGVYVANDGMATGAVAALQGAGVDPGTQSVTGQDAELTGVQRILAGRQLVTVYQPIKKIAETSAELAVPLAQGKTPPANLTPDKVNNGSKEVPSALLATTPITKDNVNQTVVKDGFLKVNDICAGSYASACKAAGVG